MNYITIRRSGATRFRPANSRLESAHEVRSSEMSLGHLPKRGVRPPCSSTSATSTASAGDRAESLGVPSNVRFGSKADIASRPRHVRSSPQSRHSSARVARPLCARSYPRAAPSTLKKSAVPKPQAPLTRRPTTKRGNIGAGIASPLIGGTTKKATSVSATAPTSVQPAQ